MQQPREFSPDFVTKMQNRMDVSYAKYGPIRDAFPTKINAIESCEKRIDQYHKTGNTEWLVDAANFLMIEFMLPAHPKAHFRATDSNESPGRFSHQEGETDLQNKDLKPIEGPD
jgi:hypothetical protein